MNSLGSSTDNNRLRDELISKGQRIETVSKFLLILINNDKIKEVPQKDVVSLVTFSPSDFDLAINLSRNYFSGINLQKLIFIHFLFITRVL